MSYIDISTVEDPFLLGSFAAMKRAAAEARRIAIQTNTNLVRYENGAVRLISPLQLRQEIAHELGLMHKIASDAGFSGEK